MSVDVACGTRAAPAPSVLPTAVYGGFGSQSYVAAVADVPIASGTSAQSSSAAASSLSAIAAFQAEDVGATVDAACSGDLAPAYGDRYGARLATDGDPATYWLSVGSPDALLELDLQSAGTDAAALATLISALQSAECRLRVLK